MNIKEKNFLRFLLIILAFLTMISFSSSVSAVDVSTADGFKAAVDNHDTDINVVADMDLTNAGTLDVSGTTINLNGNTIFAQNCTLFLQGLNFTIKNGNFDSRGGGLTSGSYGLWIGDAGETNNVTIENINITGGINVFNSTNVILKNVNITVPADFKPYAYYAIWCDENAHVTVQSGNFTSAGAAVLGLCSPINQYGNPVECPSTLNIEGGNFSTQNNDLVLQGNYFIPIIKGGTFNVSVAEEYCAEGYEPVQLGENNYSVCNHSNTTIKNAVNATCTTAGYSGDTYCSKCNKLIKNGEVINATGHKFDSNGKCEICSYRDENATTTLKDNQTNIKLDFKNSILEDNVILEVTPIPEGTTYESIKNTLLDVKDFIAFDINLLRNGVKVQPNGNVLISIPVPESFDKTRLAIYRIDGENKTEYSGKLTVIDNKNYMQFETNHFSHYILAEKAVSNPVPQNPSSDTTSAIVQNEAKAPERKLDNEPKAGALDTTLFVEVIFAISLSGYIICKKKSV